MKSRANIKGHPIHPILIPFPIAFFTATLVADGISLIYPDYNYEITHYLHLAGIIGAVAAAIPGLIDYIHTVPPASSAKKRASTHALMNSGMLLLFIISYFMRINKIESYLLIPEIPAFILMLIAGWHGGTLVHRNLIGVDMRYAEAGKWQERNIQEQEGIVELGLTTDLKANQMKLIHLKNKRIVLAKTETGFVAFDDRCSHKGGSLAGGMMICNTVQCPWHGSQFDVEDGEVKAGPAKEKILTYPLIIEGTKILIDVSKID
jgi:nitrite reductase/ring-hydroxylating ferredoxin subunit/uncharacterized membrane protein